MLHFVTRERGALTIRRLLKSLETSWLERPDFIRPVTYETLFELRRAPVGNYVFTDLDRLSSYEIDAAAVIARAVATADPAARISNWPNRTLNRYMLLRRLYEAGLNSFNVWRLDEERAPTAYPIFIRRESDAGGPESSLLRTEAEFRQAVADLQHEGKGLAGRIAVQYISAADPSGMHHKYGALRFGDRIVPQHLLVGRKWVVKRSIVGSSPMLSEQERRFVAENPHAEQLMAIFKLAETDFGRVDYCVVNDRIEVFEINTNPQFPRARVTQDDAMIRRRMVVDGILAGFRELDEPCQGRGLVQFEVPRPKLQRLRHTGLKRWLRARLTGLRWRREFGAPR